MTRIGAVLLLFSLSLGVTLADETKSVSLSEQERKFIELMDNAVLVGNFTVNRKRAGNEPDQETERQSPERYGIRSIRKVSDNQWLVDSQIKYGKLDVTVPVPVQVHFANDTPVLSVTNLTIPLVGSEFTARVMFFEDQYAGAWRHGKVGGLMYGRIEQGAMADAGRDGAVPGADQPGQSSKPAASARP